MNNKYQIEINEFKEHFWKLRDKKIVLYGIGRYTATLTEGLRDFRIIGLMDKDPGAVGKIVFGLPVMDGKTAENTADMVIINTSQSYWSVIYNRIADLKIPVYYKNGERAGKHQDFLFPKHVKTPGGETDREHLNLLIEQAEVISFDFYDTLFMRAVCSPRDVFRLMEKAARNVWTAKAGFMETRNKAIKEIGEYYSLHDLYDMIEIISGLPHRVILKMKEMELHLERKLLSPRTGMVEALNHAVEKGKEVYMISDMYLPDSFYREVCKEQGIDLPEGSLLLSNALKRSKADGSLWDYYAGEILGGRKGLHIGDHPQADGEMPGARGIKTVLTPGPWEAMCNSSVSEMASHVCSDYDSAMAGCILRRVFGNPYAAPSHGGRMWIKDNQDMGYVVFGPVMLTFLLWLDKQRKEDNVNNLVFMSRDGYFLKEDYEFLCSLNHKEPACCYLGISRQLAMSASITTKEELLEYAHMPYTGGIGELFEDRFGIKGVKEVPDQPMEFYLEEYDMEIRQRLSEHRNNYLQYLEAKQLGPKSGVVDLGFYGNNQRYLNKLTNGNLTGYYFNANLSAQNENTRHQPMKACFQKEDDLTGEKSQILKRMILIESLLTAPYGMVKAVDQKGQLVCDEKKQNQVHFQDKVEINKGIQDFIRDYMELFGDYDIDVNIEFADWFYGYCMSGAWEISDHVKQSFYNDNAMMNRLESMLFY